MSYSGKTKQANIQNVLNGIEFHYKSVLEKGRGLFTFFLEGSTVCTRRHLRMVGFV